MNTDSYASRLTAYVSRFTFYALHLAVLAALLLSLAQPLLVTAAISERRFGAIDTFDQPQAATQLGAGWTRVRFPWADMQPNDSGQWNTSFFTDEQLAKELAAGREVVGLIVNTPPWALQDGSLPGVPSGLYLRDDDPNNLWATLPGTTSPGVSNPNPGGAASEATSLGGRWRLASLQESGSASRPANSCASRSACTGNAVAGTRNHRLLSTVSSAGAPG